MSIPSPSQQPDDLKAPNPTADQPSTLGDTQAYDAAAGGVPFSPSSRDDPLIGTSIGRYTLLKKLGEGGMGSVYLADQSEPVKRQVALKLIRGHYDSHTILARFEAERQALAVMDHPNIARIYDGGVNTSPLSPGGRGVGGERDASREKFDSFTNGMPYFVMELVQGVPITEYCDQHRLSPKKRLELFVPICQAVQHAHQKGIIHRDLKPSNVLVTEVDGKPVPKVIDFGVAKATEQPLTDQSLGDTGAIVGTPTYMSPEQADPNSMDIDTRTDIYALGVMLYELLTGSTPIDAKQFRRGALLEVLRMVREVEPPRPSTKLSTAEALPSIAANRNLEPKQLQALLRGDVDWIVMKALDKDRTRRYETANGFAADVQRYLTGEAVLAHPPSRWYRVKKFVRRNRVQVLAASLVATALVAGIVGTSLGMMEANRAAGEERKAKELAETKRQEAETNLSFARKGIEFLGSVFSGLNPSRNYATIADLRNALKDNLTKAVKELEGSAIGDQLIVAEMQNTLGLSLLGLGEPEQAIKLFVKARETRSNKLGADHPDTLVCMNNLSTGFQESGMLDKALKLYEETFKLRTTRLGADHLHTIDTMGNLAASYRAAGKLDKALPLFEETVKLYQTQLGPDHSNTLHGMHNLAAGYHDAGELDKALSLYEKTLNLYRAKSGTEHPDTLETMNSLAVCYKASGKLDKALPLFEEALTIRRTKLGPEHPDTLISLGNLASGYKAANKLAEALPHYEETYKLRKARFGSDHLNTLTAMSNLALFYLDSGKLDKALPLYEETLKLQKAKLGNEHAITLQSMHNLAKGYQAAEKLDKALPLFEETLKLQRAKFGAEHQSTLATMGNLALAYHDDANMLDKAVPLYEETLKLQRVKLGNDHPETLTLMHNLAKCYQDAGLLDKALPLGEETLKLRRARLGPDHLHTISTMNNLAMAYQQAGKMEQALPLYEEALKLRKAKLGPEHPSTINSMSNLAAGYVAANRRDQALPLFEEAIKLYKVKLGPDHPNTLNAMSNLGRAYSQARQGVKAAQLLKEYIASSRKRAPKDDTGFAGKLATASLDLLKCDQFAAAEEMLRESLTIRGKKQPDMWSTFNTHSLLGGALLGQKKYTEAEPLLLKGYEGIVSRLPKDPPGADAARLAQNKALRSTMQTRIAEALDRLIQLYTETNKPDELKKWQAEKEKTASPTGKP